MSKTKYIKVSVSDRLPIRTNWYNTNDGEVFYKSSEKLWDSLEPEDIEFFFEEVPDREQEMKDMLEECQLQLEYLQDKFGATGTGNNVISRLTTLLNSIK